MGIPLASTVLVVNRSGKVVKNGKHFNNLFKEAKSAYLEKKAELKATRDDDFERKLARIESQDGRSESGRSTRTSTTATERPRKAHRRQPEYDRNDRPSSAHSSRRSSRDRSDASAPRRRREHRRSSDRTQVRPSSERGYSDSFYINDTPGEAFFARGSRTKTTPLTASNLRHSQCSSSAASSSASLSRSASAERTELTRRRSDTDAPGSRSTVGSSTIRASSPYDPHLAHGELPPALPTRYTAEEVELREKMTGLQRVLQEANCVQHSAKAVMKNLEEDPEAMAAVALTLAEISGLVQKLGPVALTAMKGSFPMIVALLLSPEFLIAGGVAVGMTVISFGGYKIIKKIKAVKEKKKLAEGGVATESAEEDDDEVQELEELSQLDRIEQWRRGLAWDPEGGSVAGTSVEGEFITPEVGKRMREDGLLADKTTKKDKGKEKTGKSKEGELEKKAREKREKEKKNQAKKDKKAEKPQKLLTFREKVEEKLPEASSSATSTAASTASTIKALFKKEPKGEVFA